MVQYVPTFENFTPIKYYGDRKRHLVCIPYTIENLHAMAKDLGIDRAWFANHPTHPHYDIPKKRLEEILARVNVVSFKDISRITKGEYLP